MQHNVENFDLLRMWRVTEKGLLPLTFPSIKTDRVRFSPDGKTLATGSQAGITLWDLTAPIPRERCTLAGFGQWERLEFCFNASGDRLASWAGAHLAVWDTAGGKQLHVWEWPGSIESVAFSRDGKHLAVGNANGTIYILRLP
jgi:WD40 repeat protein